MIPSKIIDQFTLGMFVMHPSLLPKYRGSCPIQHTILNKEKKAGVSLIEISKNKFDAGKIIYQKSIDIDEYTTYKELADKLPSLCSEGIEQLICNYDEMMQNTIQQDEQQVTKAPMIQQQFGNLYFNELEAEQLQTRFNALYGSNTTPKVYIKCGFTDSLIGTAIHFNYLNKVKFNQEVDEKILIEKLKDVEDIPVGSLHWDRQLNKKEVYVKCKGDKYEWVKFGNVTLSGYGNIEMHKFMRVILQNSPFDKEKNQRFLHQFL